MYIGEYKHILDEKGRIALPVKFRKSFKEGLVVTKGLEHCLWVYPMKEWNELAHKLAALPISQSKNRSFARLMLAGAMDVRLDKQGRMNLPHYLLEFAHLKKEVIITGLYNRLEVWNKSDWEKYKRSMEKGAESVADSLTEIGI